MVRAFLPALAIALILTACPFLPLSKLRIAIYVLFSGYPLLVWIKRRWPIGALILALAPASLAIWSLLAAIAYFLKVAPLLPWLPAVLAWVGAYRSRKRQFVLTANLIDGIACFTGVTMSFALLGFTLLNGPVANGGFNAAPGASGAIFYMLSFAEMSAVNQAVPSEGPFLPHTMNAYPTWIHAGLGALTRQNKGPAPVSLWPILPLLVLGTGLIVYCFDLRASPDRRRGWHFAMIAIVMLFIGVRIDLFIVPQTQALVFPIFFLFQYFLGADRLWRLPLRQASAAIVLLILVCLSHTVTGTAALAFFIQAIISPRWWHSRKRLLAFACLTVALCVSLIYITGNRPYSPLSSSGPNYETLRYVLSVWRGWATLLGVVAAVALMSRWKLIKWFAPAMLSILGMGYGLSTLMAENTWPGIFTGFNSVRFFHFAILGLLPSFLSFPTIPGIFLILSLIPALPVLQNVSSIYTTRPDQISPSLQAAYQFIREHTPLTSRALVENPSHATTAFTGRPAFERFDTNLYSYGMISEADYANRTFLADKILDPSTAPTTRFSDLKKLTLDQLVLTRHTSESEQQFNQRVAGFLPPGSASILFNNNSVAVLQTHAK